MAEEYTKDKHIQTLKGILEVGKRDDNTKGNVEMVTVYYPYPVQGSVPVNPEVVKNKEAEDELQPYQAP